MTPDARRRFRAWALVSCLPLAACGANENPPPTKAQSKTVAASAPRIATDAPKPVSTSAAQSATSRTAPARRRTVTNPSAGEIVMLHHSLAGTRPPIERWVEESYRLIRAPAPDKAQVRADLRAELEALAASVHDIGRLRISLRDAGLSTYDPTYGEFTIGALSAGSTIPFEEYGQTVGIRLDNAHEAQFWKISPEQAREVLDKLGQYPSTSIDLVLDVIGAVPGPKGGTITARITEYEIHNNARARGVRIVRNTVPES